jgi:hypothetical protein
VSLTSSFGDIIAVIFDFDNTLAPDSITKLLRRHKIDPRQFWLKDAKKLTGQGYDPVHAYLTLILKNIGNGKRLGKLSSVDLQKFGAGLDKTFYRGLPRFFDDLRRNVRGHPNIDIEFYVISSGLRDIMIGSQIVKTHFSAVYGSQLAGDTDKEPLKYIKQAITFTEKTRYLFEINKGVTPGNSHRDPYIVNKDIRYEDRRIPFSNMIYVGDGLTDVPCFSLVSKGVGHHEGGYAFGILDPADADSARRTLLNLLMPRRVMSVHAPRYGPKDDLGSLLRQTVETICSDIVARREEAYWKRKRRS